MKQLIAHPMHDIRVLWRQNAALRRLTLASAPVLLLGLWLGGLRTAMILTGYLQLAFRVALPGEPVENRLLQRTAALIGGMARMLFFTGMTTHTAWPLLLLAAAQAAGIVILALAKRTDTELSLLPLLASTGFAALGLFPGARFPEVWIALSGMLLLTAAYLLLHGKQNWNQLKMRFHMT